MAANPLFGWDLTFKTVEKDVKRKSDILIAFIHWNLTKRGFRSIGIGDERTLTGEEEKTELLPSGWNDKDNYTLRYVLDEKLYILHGINTEGNLIINLLRSEDLTVSNLAVNIEDSIHAMNGNIDKLIPNHKDLMYNIKRDLIDTITQRPTTTVQTQTTRDNTNDRRLESDPLRVPPRPLPCVNPDNHDLWELPSAQLPNVGRSDLDPFAPGTGGMIFNPFGPRRDVENPGLGIPGGLPRGSVPPGARFDPFGPPPGAAPPPGRRPPPDADHFPPPGFNDHMFM
ncbi:PREDICTED: proteasome inhibitor PI31 subunit [Papilio polytes]|uniref:proteasome inhibitor PI31 subunit n=1 Tax=Papilio polytes TaxID=76194 RepID=UPI0006763C3A|nr:PREDICTED: proteasome inhibitor PI31 subunit [Papilio polytes]XP_013133114.1 PREDICTED: proteasome inhibitor PI31 subunit [Papilio polytes]